jgi:hypothetical protein
MFESDECALQQDGVATVIEDLQSGIVCGQQA